MNLRSVIKSLVPPLFIHLYRKMRYGKETPPGPIWEGIYTSFKDVPLEKQKLQDHDGEQWARLIAGNTRKIREQGAHYKTIPFDVKGEHMLFPLLASAILKNKPALNILDWGGGAGVEYIHLMNSIEEKDKINYTVVEWENVCRAASSLFEGDKHIRFLPGMPANGTYDIVLIKTALQYAEDYREVLNRLCSYGPEYFFFIKLAAGDIPTYATLQKNIEGMNMAHWFINADELIGIMKKNGYSLVYKSTLEQEYDQQNFPGEYRMKRACNLLFTKS